MVSQLQESIDNLLVQKVPRSKRVLGGAVKETPETLPLNNKELLQHQVQIHQNQDKELDQLRVLIARQKQIGELINAEVENRMKCWIGSMKRSTTRPAKSSKQDAELKDIIVICSLLRYYLPLTLFLQVGPIVRLKVFEVFSA